MWPVTPAKFHYTGSKGANRRHGDKKSEAGETNAKTETIVKCEEDGEAPRAGMSTMENTVYNFRQTGFSGECCELLQATARKAEVFEGERKSRAQLRTGREKNATKEKFCWRRASWEIEGRITD